jgi:hypothetical protein
VTVVLGWSLQACSGCCTATDTVPLALDSERGAASFGKEAASALRPSVTDTTQPHSEALVSSCTPCCPDEKASDLYLALPPNLVEGWWEAPWVAPQVSVLVC